jgi:multiple sugar transport system permease protein
MHRRRLAAYTYPINILGFPFPTKHEVVPVINKSNAKMSKPQGFEARRKKNRSLKAVILFSPAILLLMVFYLEPVVLAIFFSFTNRAMTGINARVINFVGFANFLKAFQDPKFTRAIMNTVVFLLFSGILGQQCLGFLYALLMKKKNKYLRKLVGMSIIAGWITPEIVCAFIFAAYFSRTGTLNNILKLGGISPISWLFTFPMVSVIIANVWKGTAYSLLMFQAALDSISDDILEAANIDGSSAIQTLRYITIPMIKSTFAITFVNVTLGTLGTFVLIYTLTGGGPSGATTTLAVFMYEKAFVAYQVGYGMAIALIMLIIGAVLSFMYVRSMKEDTRSSLNKKVLS